TEHSPITVEAVRKYRLDPDIAAPPPALTDDTTRKGRAFRVAGPRSAARAGEKVVERVRDAWGRDWGLVWAVPRPPRPPRPPRAGA
ncbi:MAG: hypothetical protein ABI682_17310, partial [Acidobacteriota bacterium]